MLLCFLSSVSSSTQLWLLCSIYLTLGATFCAKSKGVVYSKTVPKLLYLLLEIQELTIVKNQETLSIFS